MTKEVPILFSAPMILKILTDEKTVTRRIVEPQPPDYIDFFECFGGLERIVNNSIRQFRAFLQDGKPCAFIIKNAKYLNGDRLWVRETWGIVAYSNESAYEISVRYKADNKESGWIDLDNEELWERYIKQENNHSKPILWRPSIFIPRIVSRINLDVKDSRIERLHELDDDEAWLEGFKNREEFIKFWDLKNAGRGFPWAANPWVYRVEYKRVK